jgi:hypothetical protein
MGGTCGTKWETYVQNFSQIPSPYVTTLDRTGVNLEEIGCEDVKSIELAEDSVQRDRLCGLVVRVPGYRPRGHGFDSRRCQIFWEVVGLERGPLSLWG